MDSSFFPSHRGFNNAIYRKSLVFQFLLSSLISADTYKIRIPSTGMIYTVKGDYQDNANMYTAISNYTGNTENFRPKITFRTKSGGRIPVEVTLLGDGYTQISVKEVGEDDKIN